MINGLQKVIYKLSCAAPVCVFLGIMCLAKRRNFWPGVMLILIGVLGCVYAVVFIRRCGRELPILKVTVNSIVQSDGSIIGYVIAYLVPAAGIIWEEGVVAWLLISAALIYLLVRMNDLSFCPILIVADYHCYKVSLSTGTECILISKKKGVRNSEQIGEIIRISDSLLLDAKGGKENV